MKNVLKKSVSTMLIVVMLIVPALSNGNIYFLKANAENMREDTYNVGLCKYGDYYYSAEEFGLYRYSNDFSKKELFLSGEYASYYLIYMSVHDNILYIVDNLRASIISYDESTGLKKTLYKQNNNTIGLLYFHNNKMFFGIDDAIYNMDLSSCEVTKICNGTIIEIIDSKLYYTVKNENDYIVTLRCFDLNNNNNISLFSKRFDEYSNFASANVYDIEISSGNIYLTVGYIDGSGHYYYGELYSSDKDSINFYLIEEDVGDTLFVVDNELYVTLGSDRYCGSWGLAKINNNSLIIIDESILRIGDFYDGRFINEVQNYDNRSNNGLYIYDIRTKENIKITDDSTYMNLYADYMNEEIRQRQEDGENITKEHFDIKYQRANYCDGIVSFSPSLVIPDGMIYNTGSTIYNGEIEIIDVRYLNHSDIFQEKSYIADIWLNKHDYYDETIESKVIDNILNLDSISSDIYLQLSNDTKFKTALAGWNGLKIAFDGVKALEDGLSKDEIYETLIFDLLRKVMLENEEETGNIILDAVSATGNVEDNVTKYKKAIDNFVKVPGATTESLLDILKEWKFDPKSDSFTKFYATLNDTNDFSKKWSDSKFVKGVGAVAEVADSVSDFYKRFTGYCLAMDMSDEMVVMLKEMKNNTTNLSFKIALQNIINAFDNADYAAMVCTMELAEDGTYKVMDKLFDEVTKASPTYTALRKFYEAGVAFVNLVGNTSGIIDSYYLCEATFNFVKANKASITSLANNYKLSNLEIDAGAYVYAMRTYEQVYTIDLETTVKFVKSASEEGLINLSKKLGRTIMNFLTGSDIQSSYESVVESKDSILKSLNQMFWELDNTWKFNQDYLQRDYPEIYAVYVKNELIKEEYAPIINEAYISQSGESNIEWSFPYVFYAKNSNGEKTAYALYGLGAVDGVKLTEQIGSYRHSKEWLLSDADSPLTIYDEDHFEKFNKKYFLSTYSETISGNVYTNETAVEIGNPIKKVELGIPTIRNWLGSGSIHTGSMAIAIKDLTHSRYDVVYKIYRKAENSSWRLIDTINRATVSNSYITIYEDSTAVLGEVYSYKVSSFVNFGNGITLTSEMSDEFLASKKEDAFDKRKVDTRLINPRQSVYPISRISTQAVSIENSPYIELSWDKFGNADFYDIYRISSFGSKYNLIATVDGNNCSYLDYGVDNGVTYEYVVLPFETNEKGEKIYDVTKSAEGSAEFDLGEVYSTTWIIDGRTTIKEYLEGENINIPETLEKDGYEFVCWSPAVPATMPAYDLTFTAVFEKNTPPTEDELSISIRTPSTASIDYGDSIILHLDIDRPLPDGAYIEWSESNGNFGMSVSADGTTCKISPKSNGKTVFTATVYDKDGNVISSDTQEMTAKAGFFDKIVAFFKKIFGLTKTFPEAFKGIL